MTFAEIVNSFVDNPCYETSDALYEYLSNNDVRIEEVPDIDFEQIGYLFETKTDFGPIISPRAYYKIADFFFPLYYRHAVKIWQDTIYKKKGWIYAGDKR